MKVQLHSIYLATEGEGVFIGHAQIFVRFQGCNIGCLNCDSLDTWQFQDSGGSSLDAVLIQISDLGGQGAIKRVSITGGDPLHPKHIPAVMALVDELKRRRYFVNIEAAGTRVVDQVFDRLDYISLDYKTPATGVKTGVANILKMAKQYPGKFQVKAVVENQEDFSDVLKSYKIVEDELGAINFPWCLTPCYQTTENFPQKRFQDIVQWNQQNGGVFRVIGQQHKWIYGAKEKQV